MSKSFLFGLVMGLALLLGVGVGASRLHQKDSEQAKHRAELAKYQAEVRDATPVQLGVLTQRQRIHSNLFNYYRKEKPITEFIELAKASGGIVEVDSLAAWSPVLTDPESPEKYFGELARQSDAVIRGRVTNKVSQITEDEGFIFTDYDVAVTEVLKDNVAAPVETGATITVTRPGGKVLLDGVILKARDDCFEPLPANNREVVLFLQFVKESGTYKATRNSGSFELDGSTLRPLTNVGFPPGVLRDADSFIQTF